MEKKRKVIFSILAIFIIIGFIIGGVIIKKRLAEKKQNNEAIKEVSKKTDLVTQKITFDGTIAYDDEVEYYAESSGDHKQISKVLVEQGDIVKKDKS